MEKIKSEKGFAITGGLIVLGVIAVVVIAFISTYNSLVAANENVTGKWGQVENQLQRRNDLIPNLVATVKEFEKHESDVFNGVAKARSNMMSAKTVNDVTAADGELTQALGRLMAVAEAYPELKSNANFQHLQDELAGTENRIAVARRDYNEAVQSFNTKIHTIPSSFFAGMLGYSDRDYFKADEAAHQVPKVQF